MVLSCGHQSPLNLLLTYNSGQQSSSFFGGWGGEFQIRELDKHLPPQLFSRQLEGAVQVLPAGLCFTCAASASTSHALLLPLLHMRCFCLYFTCAASASTSHALLLPLLHMRCFCLCFTCAASASASHALLLPLLHMRCFCLCFTCAASASASLALLLPLLHLRCCCYC